MFEKPRFSLMLVIVVSSLISEAYGQNRAQGSGLTAASTLGSDKSDKEAEPIAAPMASPAIAPMTSPAATLATGSVANPIASTASGLSGETPWFQRFLLPVPEATGPVDDWLSCCRPGVIGNVDYLNWSARKSGMDFASFVSSANASTSPVATESINFDRSNGFRAGLGYRFGNGWDVVWTYTYFRVESQETAAAAIGANPELFASQSFLSTGQTVKVPVSSIEADGTVQLNIQDVDAEWSSCLNDTVGFTAFGGFRWAKVDQNFNNNYSYSAGTGSVNLPNNMDAEGIRLGCEFQWRAPCGLRVFGRAAESVLVADFQTRQHEVDPADSIEINASGTTTVVVPVFEAAVGVALSQGPWEFRAGYEMSDWFNMVQVNRPAQSLFLDGYYLSLSFSR
jgi:hypothetical protein